MENHPKPRPSPPLYLGIDEAREWIDAEELTVAADDAVSDIVAYPAVPVHGPNCQHLQQLTCQLPAKNLIWIFFNPFFLAPMSGDWNVFKTKRAHPKGLDVRIPRVVRGAPHAGS